MRSVLSLTLLLAISTLFGAQARAQACGRYHVNVSILSINGKPVKNAVVSLQPITSDETKGVQFSRDKADPALFSATFSEGHSFKEFHNLLVRAPGFEKAENRIKVLSCENKAITVKLAPAGNGSAEVWQFENRVFLQVVGPDGKQIDDAELTITGDDGKELTKELKYGFVDLDLPNGRYVFHISAAGYLKKEIEADLTPIAMFSLKVQLMPEGTAP